MKKVEVAAAVIRDDGNRILLSRRPPGAEQGDLWEFPGGKLEYGETPFEALKRELHEELSLRVQRGNPLITVHHQYPNQRVQLHVFDQLVWTGVPIARENQLLKWFQLHELARLAMPAADRPVVQILESGKLP